ncbi:MAG: hypothetical protein IGQ88_07425 [Gloeomargaritaceae cyanobacterium C42_A2020_066]|nr:hypothetical protein [Gloeomargaritaceae cyanobacterium C42_A2020_066]
MGTEIQRIQRAGGQIVEVRPANHSPIPDPDIVTPPLVVEVKPQPEPVAPPVSTLPVSEPTINPPKEQDVAVDGPDGNPGSENNPGEESPTVGDQGTSEEPENLPVAVEKSEAEPSQTKALKPDSRTVSSAPIEHPAPPLAEPQPTHFPRNETTPTLLGAEGFIAVMIASQILPILHFLPLVPEMLQLLGASVTLWGIYRWLLFAKDRQKLWNFIRNVRGLEPETALPLPGEPEGETITVDADSDAKTDLGQPQTVILIVDGLWNHPRTYPRTDEGYARIQVPYGNLNTEIQRIVRKGARLVNVYNACGLDLPQGGDYPKASQGMNPLNLDIRPSSSSESKEQVIQQAHGLANAVGLGELPPSRPTSVGSSSSGSSAPLVNWAALAMTSAQGILVVLIGVQVFQKLLAW